MNTARAGHLVAWAVSALAHAAVAAWTLWAVLARTLDDRAPLGVLAHPAAAHWFAVPLAWVVFANELLAAAIAAAAAVAAAVSPPAARGMYVFFWAEYVLTTTVFAAVFLAWTGVVDVAALLATAVASAFAPAALLSVAEFLWATAALRRPGRWDRSRTAHVAWGALALAALLTAVSTVVYVERAAAATAVRGDGAGVAVPVAVLLSVVTALPVLWTGAHNLLSGYFNPYVNMSFSTTRALCTTALRIAAAIVLVAGFLHHTRAPSATL